MSDQFSPDASGNDPAASASPGSTKTPWHLWVVGGLSLPWNGFGAMDYFMTKTENPDYMASFSPEQLEYFYGFPAWVTVFWAIAVWGSVLGSVLLLARKRAAEPVFLISFLSMVVTAFHNYVLSEGLEMMGTTGAIFSVVIFLGALGLWLYAKGMVRGGVLT